MAEADLSLVQDWVSLEITPELYDRIRALWAFHADRENNNDIDGVLTTLADDCVYQLVNTGQKWTGLSGAREFYNALLAAFTDVLWVPEVLVIGPQGVFDVVVLNGKQVTEWAGMPASSERVSLRFLIWFSWNAAKGKFGGEQIYLQVVTAASALTGDEVAGGADAHAILNQWANKGKG